MRASASVLAAAPFAPLFTAAMAEAAGILRSGADSIAVYRGEFWTAKQRQATPIHEVSYRACFKPQLPAYFISRLTSPGDLVYDPFSGRGTTAIEAALHGRRVIANDVNPLSAILTRPRLELPTLDAIAARLAAIKLDAAAIRVPDLSMFYHPQTLREIVALRAYLEHRHAAGEEDAVDRWIRMVATNRLTGHSKGFFSVYTLPPNQATSAQNQLRINSTRRQAPEYRDTRVLILKKSRQLQGRLDDEARQRLHAAATSALFVTGSAATTSRIALASVQLTVTSPPFLDVVQYAQDNWLRCWFNDLDAEAIAAGITMSRTIEEWEARMAPVFAELYRVTKPGGWVAFEVGEVRKGKIRLEEHVVPLGTGAGFACEAILINEQRFTKTANIWGVGNNEAGTNSNRIVVLRKPG
jgi:SAM-dependent methyltransferase